MRNELIAIKAQRLLLNIAKYVLLVFAAFAALVPIVSCVITAFKTESEYACGTGDAGQNHPALLDEPAGRRTGRLLRPGGF